jgi:uncharacterized RDD family membrane protein YckC
MNQIQQEPMNANETELNELPQKGSEEYEPTQTHYGPLDEKEEFVDDLYASFLSRFAALVIDIVAVAYVLILGYRLFGKQFRMPTINLYDLSSFKQLSIIGTVAAVFFAYFFIFEGILARTPGKMLCGISVTHRLGGPPSLFGVLIRNLFRFVDIVLFPITGFGLAEITEKRQRLGDWLGSTTVRSTRKAGTPLQTGTDIELGSVTRRTVALLLDVVIFIGAILFFLLCLPVSRTTITENILLAGPVLVVAYWILCETLLGGTPAKLLLGLRVVDEEIRPIRVPGSLLRNFFRILDHNPLGYLCAMLSSLKQRPGDLAAQSSVIRVGWSMHRLISLLIISAVLYGIAYYGIHNPDNFIRKERVLKVGPWTLPDLPSHLKYYLGMRLNIGYLGFGQPSAPAIHEEPLYTPGEIVYLTANVSGFITKDDSAWLQQDILVTDPNGETVIDLLNVVNKRFPDKNAGKQQLTSSFLLPLRIATGQYHVSIRIRDRYGNMIGEAERKFLVK